MKSAMLAGGVLLAGGFAYRQVHHHLGRDLQPARANAYLESIRPSSHPGELPNFVIILADDLGYGDLESPVINTINWKYHHRYTTDNAAFWPLRQGPFLFDLDKDPNESYSLVELHPDLAEKLSAKMASFDAQTAENLRGWL